jgi:hypothetical protein
LELQCLEWSDAKNFADAQEMFRGYLLVRPDTREDYGEERWIGIGAIQGRVAFGVFAEPSPDTVRIISLRKAGHEEQKEYEDAIQNGLEAN